MYIETALTGERSETFGEQGRNAAKRPHQRSETARGTFDRPLPSFRLFLAQMKAEKPKDSPPTTQPGAQGGAGSWVQSSSSSTPLDTHC